MMLPVPESKNSTINNRTRGSRQGETVCVELLWIPLKLDKIGTTVVENSFASHNPTNCNAPDNIFVQRNDFSNRHDRKLFSRTKRRNDIGRNYRQINNNDDGFMYEKDLAKK